MCLLRCVSTHPKVDDAGAICWNASPQPFSIRPLTNTTPQSVVLTLFRSTAETVEHVCRQDGEEGQQCSSRQRMLRSCHNQDSTAPDLPTREALMSGWDDQEEDSEGPVEILGKRKRAEVDYQKLNTEMFGDIEAYDGEACGDADFSPRAEARKSA